MIITCEARTGMGYVHLQPCVKNRSVYDLYKDDLNNNDLGKYIDLQALEIPVKNSSVHHAVLDQMKMSEKTYRDASNDAEEFSEEYQNDLDNNGYMHGIELNLSKESFLYLIEQRAYKIHRINWLNRDFIVLSLDKAENVFNTGNIIYPFTDEKDAFAIVHIESEYSTGLIKGIISGREDLYPIDYLSKPDFILWDK